MAQFGRIDYNVLDTSGNALSGVSVTVRKQGATVNGNQSGASPLTVTVNDTGAVVAADSVAMNTGSTTYTVDSITATTIVLSGFVGTLSLTDDDRLTPTTATPTLYDDTQASATKANPLTSGSTGNVTAWAGPGFYDLLISGGAATTTLVQDYYVRGDVYYDVRLFGAKGDGSTDDSSAIQRAFDFAKQQGGGTVFIPESIYVIGTALKIYDDTDVMGVGYSSILKKKVGSAIGILTNGNANGSATGTQNNRIGVSKLKFIGENTAATIFAVRMENVDNFRIESIWCQDILNGDSASIDIDSAQHFFVRGCYVNNCTNNGIKVRCQAKASTDFIIANNVVDTTASQDGIFVANGAANAATRFIIVENVVKSTGDIGIEVGNSNSQQHTGFTISGNTVISSSGDGILLRDCADACVTDNTIRLGGNASTSGGIQIFSSETDCTDITVSGNTISGRTNGAGIRTSLASTLRSRRLTICGNTIRMGIGSTNGIEFQGFGQDSTISGNTVTNAPSVGLSLVGSSGSSRPIQRCVIVGNNIVSSTSHGISSSNLLDSAIYANRIYGNGGWGINLSDSPARNQIYQNDFDTNTSGSITGYTLDTLSGATPDVSRGSMFLVTNGGGTTVTNFTGGHEGKRITLIFTDANTTLSDASPLFLSGAFTSTANDVMELVQQGGLWYESNRSVN